MGFEGEGHSGPDALAGLDQLVLAQVLVVVASDIAGSEMAASAPTPRELHLTRSGSGAGQRQRADHAPTDDG